MAPLHGNHLIAGERVSPAGAEFSAHDPSTGAVLPTAFGEATLAEIDQAFEAAHHAHRELRQLPRHARAELLEQIAAGIEALGDALVERAGAETGLPKARLVAERGRTTGQLRRFASIVRDGAFLGCRSEPAIPDRQPPKPDLRRMLVPVGPVAVFGASNFPLAFSVAGGDTASALAAGCPVVVKAHPAHPGTSELVGEAIAEAVRGAALPLGTFSMLHGTQHAVGEEMVRHRRTCAVAFTGSQAGGLALLEIAQSRRPPIPVFAEMGSVNPTFITPGAVAARGEEIAAQLAASVSLGVGQFCTNPGLVFVVDNDDATRFAAALGRCLQEVDAGTALHAAIANAYRNGVAARQAAGADYIGRPQEDQGCGMVPALFTTSLARWRQQPLLAEELFGPSTTLVACEAADSLPAIAAELQGQLTASIHFDDGEDALVSALAAALEEVAGRLVFNGYPTGVEVCAAMQHGGPYPATTDARTTSVGDSAIERFTRPVCYQDAPAFVLPDELRTASPTAADG